MYRKATVLFPEEEHCGRTKVQKELFFFFLIPAPKW